MDLALAAAVAPMTPVAAATLDRVPTGQRVRVTAVRGEVSLRRRLLEMGLCNHTEVEVVRRAPLGDPIELRLRGYHLSLRADQARLVAVEAVGQA
jgi:ferrous iron transport protein A